MARSKSSPSARVFFIMQYEQNPRTGERLIDEQQIQRGVQYRSIREWAYIRHNKDTFSAEDEEQEYNALKLFRDMCLVDKTIDDKKRAAVKKLWQIEDIEKAAEDAFSLPMEEFARRYQRRTAGTVKPPHWHIALRCENAVEVNSVARWFGVAPEYVEIVRSKDKKNNAGAFLDCVEYLTHESEKEQRLGKYRYDNNDVHANFDWRTQIDERIAKRLKYGGNDLSQREEIRIRVLTEGLSISELCSTPDGILAYQEDYSVLDKFRLKYIQQYAPIPTTRVNYYVCGKGGDGKDLMCKALARALFPDIEHEEDIYFEVGANRATFEGYDGQPVVIWNDFRAGELLKVLGDRGNVFKVFDTFPSGRGRQNIKYGSVTLINKVNIVNSVQDFREFLDGLAGDYKDKDGNSVALAEDKGQSYRRFPFIIPLHESDFDLLMNKGVFEGTREYQQYIEIRGVQGSMKRIATMLNGDPERRRNVEGRTVRPIVDMHKQLSMRLSSSTMSDEDIDKEFGAYGTQGVLREEITPEGEQMVFFDTELTDVNGKFIDRRTPEEKAEADFMFNQITEQLDREMENGWSFEDVFTGGNDSDS